VWPEGLSQFKNPPHWGLNPRPSSLHHSALTATLRMVKKKDLVDVGVSVLIKVVLKSSMTRTLEHWDSGCTSYSLHGYVSAFFSVFKLSCVGRNRSLMKG
jgi:hypothetical protein